MSSKQILKLHPLGSKMKNYNISQLILVGFLTAPAILACAQTEGVSGQHFNNSLNVRNPFKSQLPVIQEKVEPKKITPKDIFPKPREKPIKDIPKPKDVPKLKPDEKKQEIVIPPLSVTGLVWNSDRPQAIVNGQVVNIGDFISGTEILDITKNGVNIIYQEKTATIKP